MVYKLRKLIDGFEVNPKYKGIIMVGVPDMCISKETLKVETKSGNMILTPEEQQHPISIRKFPDKFGKRKFYTISYFQFKENVEQRKMF